MALQNGGWMYLKRRCFSIIMAELSLAGRPELREASSNDERTIAVTASVSAAVPAPQQ